MKVTKIYYTWILLDTSNKEVQNQHCWIHSVKLLTCFWTALFSLHVLVDSCVQAKTSVTLRRGASSNLLLTLPRWQPPPSTDSRNKWPSHSTPNLSSQPLPTLLRPEQSLIITELPRKTQPTLTFLKYNCIFPHYCIKKKKNTDTKKNRKQFCNA